MYKRVMQFVALGLLSLSLAGVAGAATFTVTKTADTNDGTCDSDCSLREAIAAANGAVGADVINLTGVGPTITLSAQLSVSSDMTLNGPGAANLTISGNNAVRVFNIISGTVVMNDLTIADGNVSGFTLGGGIFNNGTLTLTDCILSNNTAASDGGGIFNNGTLTLTDCILSNNTAGNGSNGGGGIYNVGTLTLTNCALSNNTADFYGGGIYNDGTLTLTDCILSTNTTDNGGGILNNGTLTLAGCVLSGNSATTSGGGIYNNNLVSLTNCTLSGNNATTSGGGIYNPPIAIPVNLTGCTLSGNSATTGGGIYNGASGMLNFANTIIANSVSGGDCANSGAIMTNINNLVEDGTCSIGSIGFVSGDPNLGPLANNGGPTQTHALLPGSLAIDAGDDAAAAGIIYDQRGVGFARISDGALARSLTVDIGAFELQAATVPVPTMSEWALIILALVLLSLGTVAIRKYASVFQKVNS